MNIDYCNEPIKKVYHEMFDEALKQYNDKQKRKDRKISDYYKHIESGKQEKLFHKIIFQIGNMEDVGNRRARRACEDSPRRILSGLPRTQSISASVLGAPSYGRSNAAYPYRLYTVHHREQ